VTENRQNATRIVDLGFQYADAAAKIVSLTTPTPRDMTVIPGDAPAGSPASSLNHLLARKAEAEGTDAAASAEVQRLKVMLSRARIRQRDTIAHQLATAQAELALAQSRVDALIALTNFENSSGSTESDLQAQIEQLRAAAGNHDQQSDTQSAAAHRQNESL